VNAAVVVKGDYSFASTASGLPKEHSLFKTNKKEKQLVKSL